jgi:hypothetical protein
VNDLSNDLARPLRAGLEIPTPMAKRTISRGFSELRSLLHGFEIRANKGMHFRAAFPTEIFVTH